MADYGPEAEVRKRLDRLLDHAGWAPSEIEEEENALTGRMDYRLADLCILEAKKPATPNRPDELKLHLQQAQRYAASARQIPFLMVSDGELHYIQDVRSRRIERLYALPTRQQLLALRTEPEALRYGYIIVSPNLFEFQKRAIRDVVKDIVEGRNRLLLEMATGTGKTVVAGEIISEMNRITLERKDRRISVLFLVDRDTLEEQAAEKLSKHIPALKVNTIEHVGRVDVLVAQVATMQNRFSRDFQREHFDLIIVDEAHRSVHGGVWRKVIEYFNCPQLGLTATPARFRDDETIAYFGEPVFLYSYDTGVEDGILAPFKIHRVTTNIDQQGLAVEGRFYESPDFGVRVHVDKRDSAIVRYYEDNFYGQKCLVFAASTKQVVSLWDKFNQMFALRLEQHRAQFVVSSAENSIERQRIVAEFVDSNSEVKVLINLNILTAGFDYPELGLLFMCRYTENKSLYQQMKGRGSRIPLDEYGQIQVNEQGDPLKDHFIMTDFVGVTQWEDEDFQPHISASVEENPADQLVNQDPPAAGEMLSVDVEVGIAEVRIIDPFEGKESHVLRRIRLQLDQTKRRLADEIAFRKSQELELLDLRRALSIQAQAHKALERTSFLNLVTALRSFSPFSPITEAVLLRIAPSGFNLPALNDAFGVDLESIQAHIDGVFAEQRHAELVNKKYVSELTPTELTEFAVLEEQLSAQDHMFYEPMIRQLRALLPNEGEAK
jgi:type I site-specific restriction endonuclease